MTKPLQGTHRSLPPRTQPFHTIYDEVGNRKKRTDYAGRITDYTYDNLNRLTKIDYDGGAGNPTPRLQSTYGYDDNSRLISATNDVGTVTFGYDNLNRMRSTTDVFGHVLNHEYDRTATVNQKRLKLDGTMYATYNLDDASRLLNIVNAADSTAISFGYDNEDKVTERIYPNGVTTTYEYDNIDRLKRLKDASSSATLFDRQYSYIDANVDANRIETITELNYTRIFEYDSVDRLKTVTASNNQNESYNFDDVGNRTSSHRSNTYSYQPFNKLTASQTTQHGYDANGNMTTKGEGSNFWRYTWDSENRMTMAATRKQTVRYKYDALGRRVQRYLVGNKENTKYTYDGQDVLVDDDLGTQTKYINGPGIDNKLRVQTGSSVNYFLTDHLGSTNGLADSARSLTSQTAYDSFGNQTSGLSTRYGFTGRERDDFTGLMYYRARWYDPNLGRFISEDPIGFSGGDMNLYGYVWNNPEGFTDPTGLDGNDIADRLDRGVEIYRRLGYPDPAASGFGIPDIMGTGGGPRMTDFISQFSNMLRVGGGIGHAIYATDENAYGRAAYVAMDVQRAAEIFALLGGLRGGFGGRPSCPTGGPGVYKVTTAPDYIGQSVDMPRRVGSHFKPSGKLYGQTSQGETYYPMQGSSKLEREVYEQYQIDNARIKNLANVRNPMGGRRELYEQMIDEVIRRYGLPR